LIAKKETGQLDYLEDAVAVAVAVAVATAHF